MFLDCHDIAFVYPGVYPGTDKIILNNLSLHFKEPGFHAFFGPSGVGKTSLARILSTEVQPSGGHIETSGIKTLFYSYNLERLPGWSSVGRHLERITPEGKAERKERLLESFDLTDLLDQRFSQLSLGQQNRVNLVRYLIQEFDVLIMDESLANVDEMMRGRILLTIKEMFPQAIFIYISHNVVEVAKFCAQIWVIRGSHKTPQAISVRGQDHRRDATLDQRSLQTTMLEMMNAA
jgi:ABC-type multidrug transport system ATPase subunit